MSFARESGHSVLTQGAVFVLTFVVGIMVARYLGADQRGVVALGQTLYSFSVLAGSLGFAHAVRYWVAKKPEQTSDTLGTGIVLYLVSVTGAALLYAAAALALRSSILASVPSTVLWLFASIIPLNILSFYLMGALYGDGDVLGVNRGLVIGLTTRLVLVIAFLLRGLTAELVIVALLGLELATDLYLGRRFVNRHHAPGIRPRVIEIGAMMRYGAKSMLSEVVQWANYRIDTVFVAAMCPLPEVGKYAVAVTMAEVLMKTSSALARPLFPRVARQGTDAATTARVARTNFLLMIGMAVLLLPVAWGASRYLGIEYSGMLNAFWWTVPGTILWGVGYVVYADFLARGLAGRAFAVNAVSLVVNVGLNLALVPRLGIVGAALATSVAYAANAVIITAWFCRLHELTVAELWIPRPQDLSGLRSRVRDFLSGLTRI